VTRPAHEATVFRLTRPFRIEPFAEPTASLEPGTLLLRPVRSGICGSDLKLYTGTRERKAMLHKLPIALLHEALAEVVATGEGSSFSPGDRVVPSPNVPCTIAFPERYPSIEQACPACRPGGAGENYCTDGLFLSSNVDGMARTSFVHPEACTIRVPERVSDGIAVLTEPFATVLAGIEAAAATPGSSFLVLGNGALGILTVIALRAVLGARPDQIVVTGRHWDARAEALDDLATVVAEDGAELAESLAGRIDVAFECVGGESNEQTLGVAIQMLRPGGTAVLFGPSEAPLLFDTRAVIAKGLRLLGCNRALLRHFSSALELASGPEVAPLLERALAAKEFTVHDAHDLDDAFYYAWTKNDAGRAVTVW
jgi:ribitol-5-phosphate 2-dehydrogenase